MKYRVAVLMTCFNRKELTRRCINSLNAGIDNQDVYEIDYYVVNDGCTDGTGEMLVTEFPFVHQLEGNGNLYWNGGMYLAFVTAVKKDYDFYLWVNDDVEFYTEILERLIHTHNSIADDGCIVVGYTYDLDEKTVSYGGQRHQKGIMPLNLKMIQPSEHLEKCDSMHGNCVLIDRFVVEKIGLIDPYYTHGFGDVDYGLRASRSGIGVYLTNFPVGICAKNPNSNRNSTYKNKNLIERFRIMNSWRHRPVKDWYYFTRKFCGFLWPIRFIAPYIKLVLNRYE